MQNQIFDKKYYTFIEIITALRNDFKKSEKILKNLKKYIEINSKYNTSTMFFLSLKNHLLIDDETSTITLAVSKIKRNNTYYIRKNKSNNKKWFQNNALFDLVDDDDDSLYFEQTIPQGSNKIFMPRVNITDENNFYANYSKLKNMKLYSLHSSYININPYQTLCIWGDIIILSNKDNNGKIINIKYTPKNDSLSIEANTKYNSYFIERLLETKIPKYEFLNEYIELLNNNDKTSYLFIDDELNKKKENLEFKENDKKIVLVKKK